MNEDKTQDDTDMQTAVFIHASQNATQITEAAQRLKAPALLSVFLITLMLCNAHKVNRDA